MYINNPSSLRFTYKTKSKLVADYIIKNNIPLLGKEDGIFYFVETNELIELIKKAPFYLRMLI